MFLPQNQCFTLCEGESMRHLKRSLLAVALSTIMQQAYAVKINEIRIDQPSTDTDEYVELAGTANESLDGLSYIVIGDAPKTTSSGTVEAVINLDSLSLNGEGFFVVSEDSFTLGSSDLTIEINFENSDNVTHLLVRNFTASKGSDLDTNDDGVLDSTPWSEIIDSVSLVETPTSGDKYYSATTIGPDSFFVPAHVYRQTDISGDWVIGLYDPVGGKDTPGYANEGGTPPPEPELDFVSISEIQGLGHVSPFDGQKVKTRGAVTAIESNGFYMQSLAEDNDGNSATSDGIFVFIGSRPSVVVSDKVEVEAFVDEYIPGGASSQNLSITELTSAEIAVTGTGYLLAPVIIGEGALMPPTENIDNDGLTNYQPETDGVDFYESLEGMQVVVLNAKSVSPINRFNEIFVVPEHGDYATGTNQRGGLTIQADDYNPERIQIQIDNDFLPDFSEQVNVGDFLGNVTGVFSYSFGNYELKVTQAFSMTAAELETEVSTIVAEEGQLTVASYNVLNLDPNDQDGSADIANGQFDRLADNIMNALNSPDIIALQEIQDNSGSFNDGITDASLTYQTLVNAIIDAGGVSYQYADIAPENNQDGGQPGGNIRVGFLYNPERVQLLENSLTRLTGDAFIDSRKSLAADFQFNGEKVTLINNHFSSKGGSTPIFGQVQPFVNAREDLRAAQATIVSDYVAELVAEDAEVKVIVLGDLNEFQFNSPLLALKGYESALLTNLMETLPLLERYSYIYQGNTQALDHILASPVLAGRAEFDAVHVNAEFANQASDHDPLLAKFNFAEANNPVRFATFNVSLNRSSEGQLVTDLSSPDNAQAKAIAEIIQRNKADVILLNEFDYDANGEAIQLFKENYLEIAQNGAEPQYYDHVYFAESNTGIQSGIDLDGNGSTGGPNDAFGFGFFPGQYGMVVLSKYPIQKKSVRTFQKFLWKDMPGALLPDDSSSAGANDWYSEEVLDIFRLSSKSHWDIPLKIRGNIVHALVSHPTPPVFDGPEDRNGKRNHDEIRLWADYVSSEKSGYIYDDAGQMGGLAEEAHFVIMGDLNADPVDGDSTANAIDQLLLNPAVNQSITPVSQGAVEAATIQGGANDTQINPADFDTADFYDGGPGNIRVDYVLPSIKLNIQQAGVFWPLAADPDFDLVGNFPFPSSDHRLVWVDINNLLGRMTIKTKSYKDKKAK